MKTSPGLHPYWQLDLSYQCSGWETKVKQGSTGVMFFMECGKEARIWERSSHSWLVGSVWDQTASGWSLLVSSCIFEPIHFLPLWNNFGLFSRCSQCHLQCNPHPPPPFSFVWENWGSEGWGHSWLQAKFKHKISASEVLTSHQLFRLCSWSQYQGFFLRAAKVWWASVIVSDSHGSRISDLKPEQDLCHSGLKRHKRPCQSPPLPFPSTTPHHAPLEKKKKTYQITRV